MVGVVVGVVGGVVVGIVVGVVVGVVVGGVWYSITDLDVHLAVQTNEPSPRCMAIHAERRRALWADYTVAATAAADVAARAVRW